MSEAEKVLELSAEDAVQLLAKSGKVHFTDMRPLKIHAEIVPYSPEQNGQIFTRQISMKHQESGRIVVTEFEMSVPIRPIEQDATPAQSAVVIVKIGITYVFESKITENVIQVWSRIYGVIHSWPFWRTISYSLLANMNITPHVAPMVSPMEAAEMAGFKPTGEPAHLG